MHMLYKNAGNRTADRVSGNGPRLNYPWLMGFRQTAGLSTGWLVDEGADTAARPAAGLEWCLNLKERFCFRFAGDEASVDRCRNFLLRAGDSLGWRLRCVSTGGRLLYACLNARAIEVECADRDF